MYHYILKSLKISFWILVPLLFISNSKVDALKIPNDIEGNYSFKSSGAVENSLQGKVSFNTNTKSSNNGTPFSTLSLKFVNDQKSLEHTMQFIISERNRSAVLTAGKYGIKENIDGFLNNFDGVFGYANINELGEEPFFTTTGKIVIARIGEDDLEGYVNVTLRNNGGKKINLKGDFHAIKRN